MATNTEFDPQSRNEVSGEDVRESDAANTTEIDLESTAFETSDRKTGGSSGLNGGATHASDDTADA